jgi:hypothetical protein
MRTVKLSLLVAALILSPVAKADRLPVPAGAPPSFAAECGGCHMAFPPALLTAPDWKRVMARLDKHYGDNASLDEKTRRWCATPPAAAAWPARATRRGSPPRPGSAASIARCRRRCGAMRA